jgi:membrane-bound ClpP family serine protease
MKKQTPPAQADEKEKNFALGPENYRLMAIGFAVIVLGFVLMAGGGSDDPVHVFSEKMFSFRRITLAPILVLAGFVFEVYAIMKRTKKTDGQ